MNFKLPTMAILSLLLVPSWAQACDYVESGKYWIFQLQDMRDEYRDLLDDHNDAVDDQDRNKRCRVLREIVELLDEPMGEAVEQCKRRWNQAINYCNNINRSGAYEISQRCEDYWEYRDEELDWAEGEYSDDC